MLVVGPRSTTFLLGAASVACAVLLTDFGLQGPLAWLPAGIGAATLLRLGCDRGPYLASGMVAGGWIAGLAPPSALSLGLAAASGPVLLALYLQKSRFDRGFGRERDFIRFVLAAAVATAVAAAVAIALPGLAVASTAGANGVHAWLRCWMTAYLGTLLLVPMLVGVSRRDFAELRQQAPRLALTALATALVVSLSLVAPSPLHGFLVGPLSLILVGFTALRSHIAVAAAVAGVLTCVIGLSAEAAPVSEFVSGMFGLARASAFGLINALLIFTVQVLRSERLAALDALRDAELRHRSAILHAAHAERVRIGELLHDEVGQETTALSLLARSVARRLEHGVPVQPSDAEALVEGARRIHAATRNAVQRLLAMERHDGSLADALGALVEKLRRAGAPEIRLRLPEALRDLPAPVAEVVYRTAQEALTNAVKHAHATRIEVGLTLTGTQVELRVRDDGIGLVAQASFEGIGLRIMRGRAEQVGGRLRSISAAGAGTQIVLEVPLHPGQAPS